MSARLPLVAAQRRLGLLWIVGALLVLLLLVIQSLGGKYGSASEQAWGWFLPTVLPTLSLIVGALVATARQPRTAETVDLFVFRLSFGLSLLYLVLVAVVPLVQPFTGRPPLELMQLSNLWLGPIQGLTALALGVFFVSGRQAEKP